MLKQAKYDQAEVIEKELTKLKNEKFKQLIVPNSFYCSFENETAYQRFLSKREKFKFLETDIPAKQALEPSNIIWENREISSA